VSGTTVRPGAAFGDRDLPALFHRTDQAAIGSQRATLVWVRRQMLLLVLAAACSGLPWQARVGPVDLLALLSAAAYVGALWSTGLIARNRPRDDWQLQRSAAELVRSHCWRFAVGGAPYGMGVRDPESALEAAVHDGLHRLHTIGWREPPADGPDPGPHRLVTPGMRALRGKAFVVRRDIYLRDRVEEQRDWYRRRSAESRRGGLLWSSVTVAGTLVALTAAVAKALEVGTSMDLAGIASAAAASAVAWSEVRQHQPLVAAHALIAQELSALGVSLRHIETEPLWAVNVEVAEDTVSPDYTAWLARHRG
jgi:hypothetical protein